MQRKPLPTHPLHQVVAHDLHGEGVRMQLRLQTLDDHCGIRAAPMTTLNPQQHRLHRPKRLVDVGHLQRSLKKQSPDPRALSRLLIGPGPLQRPVRKRRMTRLIHSTRHRRPQRPQHLQRPVSRLLNASSRFSIVADSSRTPDLHTSLTGAFRTRS